MKIHSLKTEQPHFSNLEHGKNFEIRVNDRDFQKGDYLELREYCPSTIGYTGFKHYRKITHVLDLHLLLLQLPVDIPWVALGIAPCSEDEIKLVTELARLQTTCPF